MPVQLALVGCAHIHTPGFINMLKKRDDVKVKSVWDDHAVRAQKRAAELGAAVVEDVGEIWKDKEITAAIICSETDGHEALVLAGTKAKKHLFVEKPLGMGARDAYKMADAIEKAGVLFQTGYFRRGDASLRFLRDQVSAGRFGKITRVRASNCHSGALGGWFDAKPDQPEADWRWMADPARAGCGAFGDLGTHVLDILLWVFGDVESATAALDPGTARYGEQCDETGEGLLRFADGTIATLAAAWDDVANPVEFLISGTEGHAVIVNKQLFFQSKQVEGADGKNPVPAEQIPAGAPHAFDLFLDAVAGKEPALPLVTPREAAYRNAVMDALYEGARTKKWMAPKVPKPKAKSAIKAGPATGESATTEPAVLPDATPAPTEQQE